MKDSFFHFNVELTWSKIMALIILVDGTLIDIISKADGRIFMFTIPFVVALIGGKQVNDRIKEIRTKHTKTE